MGDVTAQEARSRCEAASTRAWAAVSAKRMEREEAEVVAQEAYKDRYGQYPDDDA